MKAIIYPYNGKAANPVTIPPSKSMAHRAILSACLADGESHISNIAYSEDIRATIHAMRLLGADIVEQPDSLTITGTGGRLAVQADTEVYCNESGSTLRFMIPLYLLTGQRVRFTGGGKLMLRPQTVYQRICDEQGICFEHTDHAITVQGMLRGGTYHVQGDVSSQFITGLMYALSLLDTDSVIAITPPFQSRSYVDLTVQAMRDFGVTAVFTDDNTIAIKGAQHYTARDYTVEGDYSQFAFFGVLGAISHDVVCHGVRHDSLQGDRVILDLLSRFGAEVVALEDGYCVKCAPLHGCAVDLANCPDLGPILMVLALFAEGKTRIYNAERLRLKECDRIAAMQAELTKLGGKVEASGGEIIIHGIANASATAEIEAHIDHRVVMSMAVMAARSHNAVTINGAENINKSYPDFFEDLGKVGMELEVHNEHAG